MANVNAQITDAITQTNVKVLGEAPAVALASLYQTIGNSIAMAAANAVFAQQQANILYQTATTLGVAKLLSLSIK
jgi:Killing trait